MVRLLSPYHLIPRRPPLVVGLLALIGLCAALPAHGQTSLRQVNRNTTVDEISFTFEESQTFRPNQFKQQMALTEPSFWDGIRSVLPLLSARVHPFDPLTLQKDVVRLRNFYRRNGFPRTQIDYASSELDSTDNEIHVVLAINEGPPLIIQDVGFFTPEGSYAVRQFEGTMRDQWIDFRDRNTFETGERFSNAQYVRLQSRVVQWLENQGYAFPEVSADSTIDQQALTADIRFTVDAGPRGRIAEIDITGNDRVDDAVVRRELPFQVGDRFSGDALSRAEQQLFSLNLFRLAVVSVPDQPRDSTVTVRVLVQETDPRSVSAQTGYNFQEGALLEGRWVHRNFFGGARTFTADATWQPGIGANVGTDRLTEQVNQRFRISGALRQPYLFRRKLSGIVSPFYIRERGARLTGYEAGLNTTLIYQLLPFRLLTLEHNYSRAATPNRNVPIRLRDERSVTDLYSKSLFTLSARLGRLDDYLSPERGFLIRPFAEASGQVLGSALNYYKIGSEASAYQPLTDQVRLAGRLSIGRLVTIGRSRYNEQAAFNEFGIIPDDGLRLLENRFDDVRFYAGGANDVRGWGPRLLGPKVAQADTSFGEKDLDGDGEIDPDEQELPVCHGDGEPARNCEQVQFTNFRYERLGGLSKLAVNLEAHLPFPLLGPAWSSAVFLDFGQVSEGSLFFNDLRFGTGAGIRYRTPVGHIRLDLAFKINPTDEDLIDPQDAFHRSIGRDPDIEPNFWRRFRLHLSIGQAF